jgi:hypothetical protein
MALFIQIQNGQPVDHPVYDWNLIQAYGQIPQGWAMFNRVQQPEGLITSPFQTAQCTYDLSSDGVTWEDVWTAVEMTDAEKSELIAQTEANPPGPNITLDTETLQWKPNTTKPNDGQKYYWNFSIGEWTVIKDTPA